MSIKNNREYREIFFPLIIKESEKRIDSDYYIEGFATTFDKPYMLYEYDKNKYYEKIERSALVGADMNDVIMQYDHQGKVMARQSNNTLGLEALDNGLFVYADLSKSKASQELYEEIRNGLVTKMSWAFTIDDDEYNNKTKTRTIKKIRKVYDVSAVSMPANSDTSISARSYFDGVIEVERQELLEQKRRCLVLKTYTF